MCIPTAVNILFTRIQPFLSKIFKSDPSAIQRRGYTATDLNCIYVSNSQNRHPVPKYHISMISTEQYEDKMHR